MGIKQQRLVGYMLIGGGILLQMMILVLIGLGQSGIPLLLAGLIPSAILIFYGLKAVKSSKRDIFISNVQDRSYQKGSSTAFWVLLTSIMVDNMFSILPRENIHAALIYIGIFSVIVGIIYHKYISEVVFSSGQNETL